MRPAARRRSPFACLAAGLLAWLAAAPALPQANTSEAQVGAPVATGSGPLAVTVVAEILEEHPGPDGRAQRRWVPATRLRAGEEVYYTIRVRNPGRRPVLDVVVTKRLPFGVVYRRGSAVGPDCVVQFSADGGTSFAPDRPPATRPGVKGGRAEPLVEYTHVRWLLSRPLAPGATALLRFRAVFT